MAPVVVYLAVIIISVFAIIFFGNKFFTGEGMSPPEKNRALIITLLGVLAMMVSLVSLAIKWLFD